MILLASFGHAESHTCHPNKMSDIGVKNDKISHPVEFALALIVEAKLKDLVIAVLAHRRIWIL